MNEPDSRVIFEFNGFRADPLKRRLYSGRDQLAVTPKAFDTLLVLIANRGNVVSKNDLIDAVWAETAVEENNLTQQIAALRRALGERAGDHRFIVTLPGKGYSFVAPVAETEVAGEEILLLSASRSAVTIDIDSSSLFNWRRFFEGGRLGSSIAAVYIAIVCFVAFWPIVNGSKHSQPQTVAVFGFRTSSPTDAILGMGISDTMRAKIGNLEDVSLRPERPGIVPDDVLIAGRDVNAEVVLSGSIQRSEGQVRVAIEMVDVKRERVVWGQTFDYNEPDRFRVQDAIADEVLKVLGGTTIRGT